MKVQSITVKESIALINTVKLFLPPIQRNVVWDVRRINMYFASLYHGYPLGTLIFGRMDKSTAAKYPLYQFRNEYWERQIKHNELASRNLFSREVYGCLLYTSRCVYETGHLLKLYHH